MTRKHKCASCIHCEMCKWIDEVKQSGCDFYAESAEPCEDCVSREAAKAVVKKHFGQSIPWTCQPITEDLDALPSVTPIKPKEQFKEKYIKKDCENCQHYIDGNGDCDNCDYPDYRNYEEMHNCKNCGHSTGTGLYDCDAEGCSLHDKWISIQTDEIKVGDLKKTGRYFPQIPEALAQACKGGEK